MNVLRIKSGLMDNNTYLVLDKEHKVGVIIDPAKRNHFLVDYLVGSEYKFKYIILTHGHFDHVWDTQKIKDITGAKIAIHQNDAKMLEKELENAKTGGKADILLNGGEVLECGNMSFDIIHTPGHSAGSICIACEDALFTGDTLFRDTIGRTDLGGDSAQMLETLKKLAKIERDYTVFPGHGDKTTLEREKAYNRYLCF